MIIESLVREAVRSIQKNLSVQEVQGRCGNAAYAEAVKRLQSDRPITAQQFFAKQEADKREFFRNRASIGQKSERVSQEDHCCGLICPDTSIGGKSTI